MFSEINLNVFFQMNIVPAGIFLFMTIFMIANRHYESLIARKFRPLVSLLLFIIIIDNLDNAFYLRKIIDIRRTIVGVLGYDIRILILLLLFFIMLRETKAKWISLFWIPAIICFIITPLAFFTKLIFWYDEKTGVLLRGPLAFTPHIVMGIYILFIVAFGFHKFFHKSPEEGIIVIIGCILNILAVYAEAKYLYRGVLMGTIALVILAYYLYIHTEYLKKDILTDTFNRLVYLADTKKTDEITSLIMIDVNNLKTLNDTLGHDEGDKALKTCAEKIKESLPRGCVLYRVGGDEFVVLCKKQSNIEHIVTKIRNSMKGTSYSWAVGYSELVDNDIDKTFKIADKNMYTEKQKMKCKV